MSDTPDETHDRPGCLYMDSDLPRHGAYWIHGTECTGHGAPSNRSNTIAGELEAIRAKAPPQTEEDKRNEYERRGR